ncbi:unnamed protein product [Thlaspi arvense]|uniref:Uncharacterized protein n=1 Tax=Thlaspi arvense TaxID=13288 RepID=A0AAU9RH13_THLAR|nr:unnamed protein product [Thlaspi arvense]
MCGSNFNAELGDFGLARLVDHEKGHQTMVLAGTMGSMAPECAVTSKASKESDIITGNNLWEETHRYKDGMKRDGRVGVGAIWKRKLLEAVGLTLCEQFEEQEMEHLMVAGLWCAHPEHNLRPSTWQVEQFPRLHYQICQQQCRSQHTFVL